MLTEEMKTYAKRSVLCWLATVSEQGAPNVSPKELFVTEGDSHILIANIASPGSMRNMRHQPHVCVSFIDVFVQKGFKVLGEASIISRHDADFPERVKPLQEMAGAAFPVSSFTAIHITAVEPIIAPSYRFYPETTEQKQIAQAMQSYGVQPQTKG
ncbi:pyridoxamine 5'-phosphate oxidase family protein [Marinicella sp. W31]|uniref:pyridoxamine 5'-phosphate oxidase family protein n=1 Tax=Marinicella sp. W31 TaxID=3023713 RepID=UPI0037566985